MNRKPVVPQIAANLPFAGLLKSALRKWSYNFMGATYDSAPDTRINRILERLYRGSGLWRVTGYLETDCPTCNGNGLVDLPEGGEMECPDCVTHDICPQCGAWIGYSQFGIRVCAECGWSLDYASELRKKFAQPE